MTEFQWQVVLALCRAVLAMLAYGTANADISYTDEKLMKKAIDLDKIKDIHYEDN